MTVAALERAARAAGGKIIAVLAARFRDLSLAEDAYSEACLRAAQTWPSDGAPDDPAAWLYRAAYRRALNALRASKLRERLLPEQPLPEPHAEDAMLDDARLIPDERLRLIFVCCHPAVAMEARAALTLRLVCGLTTQEIARAFLLPEPTLAQRLARAKRKIQDAGVSYEVPGPEAWPERLAAVLSTLEVAYAKAHEDAAGAGPHAGYAAEMLELTRVLCELLPSEPGALSLAATVRYAEARRPARLDREGAMIPLSEQDPARWSSPLIAEANTFLVRAMNVGRPDARVFQATIHGLWCARAGLHEPAPWRQVLESYDVLLHYRDDPVVRLNRAVAVAEIHGPQLALAELTQLSSERLQGFAPYHAVRADLLRRLGRTEEALESYAAALAQGVGEAEAIWMRRQRTALLAARDERERKGI